MRFITFMILIFSVLIFFPTGFLSAQDSTKAKDKNSNIQHGQHFIDKDGDGYNDNAPDHDNDGIPNGLDPDWKKEKGQKGKQKRWRYIDLDGDGINDNLQADQKVQTPEHQNRYGQQNETSIDGQKNKSGGQQKKKKGSRN